MGKKSGSDIDMFRITPKGMTNGLLVTQTYSETVPLMKYRLHKHNSRDYGELPTFELMLELERVGWGKECRRPSKKCSPYRHGESSKVWFYWKGINKHYLRALLQSEQLGVVYHHQPCIYYKTLAALPKHMLSAVKPWQPHSYYKVLLQQAKKKTTGDIGDQHYLEVETGP